MTTDVSKILFGFSQAVFFATPKPKVIPDFEMALGLLQANNILRAETAMQWPSTARAALGEYLTQWLIVEMMQIEAGTSLPYPAGFCEGSSSTRLGAPFLGYIFERSIALQSLYQRSLQVTRDR